MLESVLAWEGGGGEARGGETNKRDLCMFERGTRTRTEVHDLGGVGGRAQVKLSCRGKETGSALFVATLDSSAQWL